MLEFTPGGLLGALQCTPAVCPSALPHCSSVCLPSRPGNPRPGESGPRFPVPGRIGKRGISPIPDSGRIGNRGNLPSPIPGQMGNRGNGNWGFPGGSASESSLNLIFKKTVGTSLVEWRPHRLKLPHCAQNAARGGGARFQVAELGGP